MRALRCSRLRHPAARFSVAVRRKRSGRSTSGANVRGGEPQEYADEQLRSIGASFADDPGRADLVGAADAAGGDTELGGGARPPVQPDRCPLGARFDHRPTLVAHRTEDLNRSIEGARYMAARIPGATLAELPGIDWLPFGDDAGRAAGRGGGVPDRRKRWPDTDRVLATVLFTDIVGSTEKAAALGDGRWRELRAAHHERAFVAFWTLHRRSEVDTAGDGFFATFDGPARAARCALAIAESVRLSRASRSEPGVTRARSSSSATTSPGLRSTSARGSPRWRNPEEALASSTVKDLTAGSGLRVRGRRRARAEGRPRPLASVPGPGLGEVSRGPDARSPARSLAPVMGLRKYTSQAEDDQQQPYPQRAGDR